MLYTNVVAKIKKTLHVQSLFSENLAVYEMIMINIVEPER
jgi:hypothetical protein